MTYKHLIVSSQEMKKELDVRFLDGWNFYGDLTIEHWKIFVQGPFCIKLCVARNIQMQCELTFLIGSSKKNAIYVLCKTNMRSWYHKKICIFCNKIWFALTHVSCYSVSVMQNIIIIINWLTNITYKYSNYKFTNKLITTTDKKWENVNIKFVNISYWKQYLF